jgi:MazG family protein
VGKTGERFERAVKIMERLRSPGGCPWDREQNFDSIKPYTIEETYEVVEAIDARDFQSLKGELGDLLLQVLFYSQMAAEAGHFSIDEVLEELAEKLVRRHPHVFGEVKADTSGEVLRNWEAIKVQERGEETEKRRKSKLAGASTGLPALIEAYKLSSLAANAGFDWPEIQGIFDKLEEETKELREHLRMAPAPKPTGRGIAGAGAVRPPDDLRPRLEGEIGDLLFVVVNLARYLSLDPESSLKRTNRKFRRRFEFVENELRARGSSPEQSSLDEMESLWQQAKNLELQRR